MNFDTKMTYAAIVGSIGVALGKGNSWVSLPVMILFAIICTIPTADHLKENKE